MGRYRLTLVYDFDADADAEAEAKAGMAAQLAEPLTGTPGAVLVRAPKNSRERKRWLYLVATQATPKAGGEE